MAKRLLVLFVSYVIGVHCGVLSGKALFCRDPDTGKLHAVNTTWTATSFCGNYTCSIKRRNNTDKTPVPLREFNVTSIQETTSTTEQTPIITIEKKIQPDIQPLLHKNRIPNQNNMFQKVSKTAAENKHLGTDKYFNALEKGPMKAHKCKKHRAQVLNIPTGTDRYLTEQEIDNIADMLHTIKKSDLDAIVDIYNLAQDIYKEIDNITDEEIKNEALNILKEEDKHGDKTNKPTSYWYDSLANKERAIENDEMEIQNTYDVYSTLRPMESQTEAPIQTESAPSNDISEKVPYYYPVTQFQRISSYTHPAIKVNTPAYDETRYYEKYYAQRMEPDTYIPSSRKLIQPSIYLPYPFTNIHPSNTTDTRNFYYANPWMSDYYNSYYNKYYQPYYSAYVAPVPKAVMMNPLLSGEVQNAPSEKTPVKRGYTKEKEAVAEDDLVDTLLKGQKSPAWKTEPIPIEILKDIKADIDTSRLLKAFPLRKKVKLEKVGKVINVKELANEANRNKRAPRFVPETVEQPSHGETEVVLERVTCYDRTVPGYFRMGNQTQPYPECCPQLIDTR